MQCSGTQQEPSQNHSLFDQWSDWWDWTVWFYQWTQANHVWSRSIFSSTWTWLFLSFSSDFRKMRGRNCWRSWWRKCCCKLSLKEEEDLSSKCCRKQHIARNHEQSTDDACIFPSLQWWSRTCFPQYEVSFHICDFHQAGKSLSSKCHQPSLISAAFCMFQSNTSWLSVHLLWLEDCKDNIQCV